MVPGAGYAFGLRTTALAFLPNGSSEFSKCSSASIPATKAPASGWRSFEKWSNEWAARWGSNPSKAKAAASGWSSKRGWPEFKTHVPARKGYLGFFGGKGGFFLTD